MIIQVTDKEIKAIQLNSDKRYWFNGFTHDASGRVDVPALVVYTLLTKNGLPHQDDINPEDFMGYYEVENPENRFSIKIKKL